MGADIHVSVEVRDKNGIWKVAKNPLVACDMCESTGEDRRYQICKFCEQKPNEHADGIKCLYMDTSIELIYAPCYWCKGKKKRRIEFYEGRNYNFFARLANVRNHGVEALSDDRGLPPDVTPAVEKMWDWNNGGNTDLHSHGYFTLAELDQHKDWKSYDGFFEITTLPLLRKLGAPEDVRFLFCFDN